MAQVYVSIGTNIDRETNLRDALRRLAHRFGELAMSKVYESASVGFQGENFFNQVVGFKTDHSPEEVALALREIEALQGRVRGVKKYAPRTIDLDLLLYDDLVRKTDSISLPRKEIVKYAFVLKPLAEIAGSTRHPVSGQRYRDLWASFDSADQKIWPAAFAPEV